MLHRNVEGLSNKGNYWNKIGASLSILYTNADTNANKLNELQLLIKSLQHKPEIIAITEVKPKHKWHSNTNELQLPGYHMFSNDLDCIHSRGVLIYVDKCLDCSEITIGSKFCENVFIRINQDLVIGNIGYIEVQIVAKKSIWNYVIL